MWHGAWFCLGGVSRRLNGSLAGVYSDKKRTGVCVLPQQTVTALILFSVGGPGQGVGVRVELALSGLIKETVGLWRRGRL